MPGDSGAQREAEADQRVEHFLPVRNEMGETPVWVTGLCLPGRGLDSDAPPGASRMGTLYWLDAEGGSVYHWDPESAHWGYRSLDAPVKALVRKAPRGFVAVTEKGLFLWDAGEGGSDERGSLGQSSSARDQQAHPPGSDSPDDANTEIESPGTEFRLMPGTAIQNPNIYYNGAVVDRRGRLLVDAYSETDIAAGGGSTAEEGIRAQAGTTFAGGSIFRIEPRGGRTAEGSSASACLLVELDRGIALPKGMCLSPDGSRLYLSEMLRKRILVYDYDVKKGEVGNRRVFAEMAGGEGYPGGIAVDGEGFVWCAHWGGWRVTRHAPDGVKDRVFPLPVSIVTGVGFGGEGFGDLFITTARFGLSDEEIESQPLAGDLFRMRTGTWGTAGAEFLE